MLEPSKLWLAAKLKDDICVCVKVERGVMDDVGVMLPVTDGVLDEVRLVLTVLPVTVLERELVYEGV